LSTQIWKIIQIPPYDDENKGSEQDVPFYLLLAQQYEKLKDVTISQES